MEGEQGRGLGDVGSPPRAGCNLVSFPSTDTLCSQETHWLELAWWGGAELIVDWSMASSSQCVFWLQRVSVLGKGSPGCSQREAGFTSPSPGLLPFHCGLRSKGLL
ncbi:unnamed protein product [Gadus morhua 'NCC']